MTIHGERRNGGLHVTIDGKPLKLRRSLKVWNHSPTGFECGYAGSGPAQLALAILLEAGASDEVAGHLHQRFKFTFVMHWRAPFTVDLNVAEWIAGQGDRYD